MNSQATRRTTLALGLALALGLGVTAQASAGAPRSVSGKPSDNITRIADFYGAYIDAVTDEGSGDLRDALRSPLPHPRLPEGTERLGGEEHADGVLRAQNVPSRGRSPTTAPPPPVTEAVVTLTWSAGQPPPSSST